jgi:hypothetical protein
MVDPIRYGRPVPTWEGETRGPHRPGRPRRCDKEQYDQVREAAGWIERSPDGGIAEPQVTFHPAHEVFLPAGSN